MYRNIIRAIAVLFAAFAAAMALPGFYRMIPASWHGDYKKIVYSEVLGDFIISKSIYSDDPSDRSGIRYEIRDSKATPIRPNRSIRWPCLKTLRSLSTKDVCLKPSVVSPSRQSVCLRTIMRSTSATAEAGTTDCSI